MKLWPEYLPDPMTETRLTPAIYMNGKIYHSSRGTSDAFTVDLLLDWPTLRHLIISESLVLFSPDLTDTRQWPFLAEMRSDPTVKLHETTEWARASIRDGRRRYWIVPVSQWGWSECTPLFLQFINDVFQHCYGLVRPTPPSLGKRLMLEPWLQQRAEDDRYGDSDWPAQRPEKRGAEWLTGHRKRHALPPKAARMRIKDELTGGRIEHTSEILPGYWKLDQDNALVSHYARHPTGTAVRHLGNGREPIGVSWFCQVTVTVPEMLPLGPFPVRKPFLYWPVSPGVYGCWLWKEQIEDSLAAGCSVTIRDGWCWKWWTEDNRAWAEMMIRLRETAPNEEVRKAVKRIAAAAISCMGIGDAAYEYVDAAEYDPATDQVLYDKRGRLNYVLRSTRTSTRPTPVHWYAYTWMQVARTLYRMALPHAQANALVALHTDCLWSRQRPEPAPGWKLEEVLSGST